MYIEELEVVRHEQVDRRRQAARDGNPAGLREAQAIIDAIDRAIADELRLAEPTPTDREVRL